MRNFQAEYEWAQDHGFDFGVSYDTGNGAIVTHG
jgi:hypothetical protein